MNIDELCEMSTITRGNNFLKRWGQNHSPFFAHWVAQFKWANERIFIRPEDVYFSQTNLYNSLPLDEAVKACKNMYTYELAKVTIQISDPVVMTVEKRVSSTFAEQLGVVGMPENLVLFLIAGPINSNMWTVL